MKSIASLSADLSKFGNEVIENVKKAQSNTAYVIQQDAMMYAPVNTGAYRKSITLGETTYENGAIKTEVYTEATVTDLSGREYNLGELIEHGTRPHLIEPSRATALRFFKGGNVVFAKYVFHPGTISQPHFLPALNKNIALYKSNIQKAIKEAK